MKQKSGPGKAPADQMLKDIPDTRKTAAFPRGSGSRGFSPNANDQE